MELKFYFGYSYYLRPKRVSVIVHFERKIKMDNELENTYIADNLKTSINNDKPFLTILQFVFTNWTNVQPQPDCSSGGIIKRKVSPKICQSYIWCIRIIIVKNFRTLGHFMLIKAYFRKCLPNKFPFRRPTYHFRGHEGAVMILDIDRNLPEVDM